MVDFRTYSSWLDECASYLRKNRPDLPIFDVEPVYLKTAFDKKMPPEDMFSTADVQLATSRDPALLNYFRFDLAGRLSRDRPDVKLADFADNSIEEAYRSGISVEQFLEQDLPLRRFASRGDSKRKRGILVVAGIAVALLLIRILSIAVVHSRVSSQLITPDQPSAEVSTNANTTSQPVTDSVPSSTLSEFSTDSDEQNYRAKSATADSEIEKPSILSASASGGVEDGHGQITLHWLTSNATSGAVIVNGQSTPIEPSFGEKTVVVPFGHASVKFVFSNSAGTVSEEHDQNIFAPERENPDQGAGPQRSYPAAPQNRPTIVGFSLSVSTGGWHAQWNVSGADRITLAVDGRVYVDLPNERGTAHLNGLQVGSAVTLTAYNGSATVQRSFVAAGFSQYGSLSP